MEVSPALITLTPGLKVAALTGSLAETDVIVTGPLITWPSGLLGVGTDH